MDILNRLTNLLSRKFLVTVGVAAALPVLKDLVSDPSFRCMYYVAAGIAGLYIVADVVQDAIRLRIQTTSRGEGDRAR